MWNYYKNGNVIIAYSIFAFLLILVLFCISIIYIQISIELMCIKKDLHILVKNVAILNCDKEALKDYSYKFDMEGIKRDLNLVIKKNYNNISLNKFYYDYSENNFIIELNIKIKPILNVLNERKFEQKYKIKFKCMEVLNKK